MKLLPDTSNSRCGLLNSLVNKPNKEYLYNIPENSITGNIQTLIDCYIYFTIFLHQNSFKISNVSLTRRNTDCYPKNSSIEGHEKDRRIKLLELLLIKPVLIESESFTQ